MMLETGRVVAVEGDGVWVETIRKTTCGTCAAQKGCGHGIINRISEGRRSLIRALPGRLLPRDCAVDDEVRISIPEEVILRGSIIVYVVPILCLLLGAALAVAALPAAGDLAAVTGAVSGFALGFAMVRWHARRHRNDQTLQPTLVEILHSGSQPVRFT